MPCPTCDHTMHVIVTDYAGMRHSLCPRCGTHTVDHIGYGGIPGAVSRISTWVPKLVERCRKLRATVTDGADACEWDRLGVMEAIYKPEDRPKGV